MKFDLFGRIFGALLRRKLEQEAAQAYNGPVGSVVKAAFQPVVDAALEQGKAAAVAAIAQEIGRLPVAGASAQALTQTATAPVQALTVKL